MNWQKIKSAFSNAFDYDDGRADVTEEEMALLDRLAAFVVRRRLTTPAILLLETTSPFNFVASSAMSFFRPLFGMIFSTKEYKKIEKLLEKRCSISLLAERIELRDNEETAKRKQAREERKKNRKS